MPQLQRRFIPPRAEFGFISGGNYVYSLSKTKESEIDIEKLSLEEIEVILSSVANRLIKGEELPFSAAFIQKIPFSKVGPIRPLLPATRAKYFLNLSVEELKERYSSLNYTDWEEQGMIERWMQLLLGTNSGPTQTVL